MFVGLFGDGGVVLGLEEVCKWTGLGWEEVFKRTGLLGEGVAIWGRGSVGQASLEGARCARSQATGGDAVEEMRMFVGLFGDGGVVLGLEEVCKWTGLGWEEVFKRTGLLGEGVAIWGRGSVGQASLEGAVVVDGGNWGIGDTGWGWEA